jgi:hypothetical protein
LNLRLTRPFVDIFFCACLNSAGHFWGYLRMYVMSTLGLEICGRLRCRREYGLEQFIGNITFTSSHHYRFVRTNDGSYRKETAYLRHASCPSTGHIIMLLYHNRRQHRTATPHDNIAHDTIFSPLTDLVQQHSNAHNTTPCLMLVLSSMPLHSILRQPLPQRRITTRTHSSN